MSEAHVSHHLKRNPLFLGAIALMVFAPSLITFYMPSLIVGLPDAVWLGGGWLVGVLAVLVGDEALHHEEKKLVVAAAAAFGGYISMTSEEEHVVHPATA
jgi:hypothetical protein